MFSLFFISLLYRDLSCLRLITRYVNSTIDFYLWRSNKIWSHNKPWNIAFQNVFFVIETKQTGDALGEMEFFCAFIYCIPIGFALSRNFYTISYTLTTIVYIVLRRFICSPYVNLKNKRFSWKTNWLRTREFNVHVMTISVSYIGRFILFHDYFILLYSIKSYRKYGRKLTSKVWIINLFV